MQTHAPKKMLVQLHHIAIAALSGALFLFAPFTTAFFITIFLIWLVFQLDSRIIASVAIVFLICIPFLLTFGQDARAEQIAVYAYFLLAITVALQIVEFKREGIRKQKAESVPKPATVPNEPEQKNETEPNSVSLVHTRDIVPPRISRPRTRLTAVRKTGKPRLASPSNVDAVFPQKKTRALRRPRAHD
jgi:hypothetical protein